MGAPAAFGLLLAATAVQGVAQHRAAKAAKAAARSNEAVARIQRANALARGGREEQRHRRAVRAFIASQQAQYAGGGVDLSSGSVLDVVGSTELLGELDALTIRTNAYREAWGYEMQGNQYAAEAQAAETQSLLQPVGTILGGVSQAAAYRASTR